MIETVFSAMMLIAPGPKLVSIVCLMEIVSTPVDENPFFKNTELYIVPFGLNMKFWSVLDPDAIKSILVTSFCKNVLFPEISPLNAKKSSILVEGKTIIWTFSGVVPLKV